MKAAFGAILSGMLGVACLPGRGDSPSLPGNGWEASHYTALWTQSPFAVATPDAAPESADYALVGIAQIDGVSYASLTDKKSSEHFLLASDKPVHGLKLVSITSGKDAASSSATVEKDGKSMTLKLEQGPPPAAIPAPPQPQGVPPGAIPGSIVPPQPPGNRPPGAPNGPPPVSQRPRIIHVPPPPTVQPRMQPPPQSQ